MAGGWGGSSSTAVKNSRPSSCRHSRLPNRRRRHSRYRRRGCLDREARTPPSPEKLHPLLRESGPRSNASKYPSPPRFRFRRCIHPARRHRRNTYQAYHRSTPFLRLSRSTDTHLGNKDVPRCIHFLRVEARHLARQLHCRQQHPPADSDGRRRDHHRRRCSPTPHKARACLYGELDERELETP